jgi:hypothetical protein
MGDNRIANCKEIGDRRAEVHAILRRYEGDALWDTIKARDVDPQIIEHIQFELEHGKDLAQIRRELKLGSATSKAWQKISAALKAGYRVDSTGLFVRMLGRQEKLASKLYKMLDIYLDEDTEKLKKEDDEGVRLLDSYSKAITPMIDAMNRLHQSTVKIGKDLGVFTDGADGKGGSAPQIIIQNNVPMPSPQQILDAKVKKPDVLIKS